MALVLTPEILVRAYAAGIFPMAESREDPELHWFDPPQRGILPLEAFHIPRRLARTVRKAPFEIRIDGAFRAVMTHCASAPGRGGSWINDAILDLYGGLHDLGLAHSVECWREGELIGGLYGVALGAAFFGESMFSLAADASKVALVHLVARLAWGGFLLLDTQFVTAHLATFGAIEIPRAAYKERLAEAIAERGRFDAMPLDLPPQEVLQSITQTS